MINLFRIFKNKFEFYYLKKIQKLNVPSKQDDIFNELKFNREKGLEKINEITKKFFDIKYTEKNSMFSEHIIIFSALSEKFANNKEFKNILEIGTYDGKTAIILSELFPNATITTIDLPDNDENFTSTYDRKEDQDFIKKRNGILSTKKNVKFEQLNSLNLYAYPSGIYDLLWKMETMIFLLLLLTLLTLLDYLKKMVL